MSLFSPSELSFTSIPLTSSSTASTSNLLRSDARKPLNYRDLILDTAITEGSNIGNCKVLIGDTILGYTEIWCGVRAEVEDVLNGEEHGGRIVVSVECAPTTSTTIPSLLPLHLSTLLSSLYETSVLPPSLLQHLTILPSKKAWVLYLDVLILSASGGNVIDLSIIASRTALAVSRLPSTKVIGFESVVGINGVRGEGEVEMGTGKDLELGISGLVKGGIGGKAIVDFELVDGGWELGERLRSWEELPVGITLNLINQLPHLDATILEESSSSSQIIFCFTSKGDLCGVKQLGEGEIEFSRIMSLLGEAKKFSSELIQVLNARLKDA